MTNLEFETIAGLTEAYGLPRIIELLADLCRMRADHGQGSRTALEDLGERLDDLAITARLSGIE